jgi:hypothetical protein
MRRGRLLDRQRQERSVCRIVYDRQNSIEPLVLGQSLHLLPHARMRCCEATNIEQGDVPRRGVSACRRAGQRRESMPA